MNILNPKQIPNCNYYIVDDEIESISPNCFNRINIKELIINDNVKSIGESAFFRCTNLSSVRLPTTIKTLENLTFGSCTSLLNLEIPNSVSRIVKMSFWSCGVISITINSSLTEIENLAFAGCQFLQSINLPSTVKKIGNSAFAKCSQLKEIILNHKIIIDEAFFDGLVDHNCKVINNEIILTSKNDSIKIKLCSHEFTDRTQDPNYTQTIYLSLPSEKFKLTKKDWYIYID